MTQIIAKEALVVDGFGREFEGYRYDSTNVSFIIVEAKPGEGPKLHSHRTRKSLSCSKGRPPSPLAAIPLKFGPGRL